MATGRLPDFVIIGAMKCGTTSLHGILSRHPDIFMSQEKELHFFTAAYNYHRGVAWYRRQFRSDRRLCAEASPSYAAWPKHPGVPERMRELIPEARLIYCVRDPIDRAISHYRHAMANGLYRMPIDEGIRREPFLRQGRYATQLSRYFGAGWSAERILVVQAEQLRAHRAEVVSRVLSFLGLETSGLDVASTSDRHVTDRKRVPSDRGTRLKDRIAPMMQHVPWTLRTHLERAILWPLSSPMPMLSLKEETRAFLADQFAEEARRLRDYTGQSFAGWSV